MSQTELLISKAMHLKPAERFMVIESLIKSLDVPDPRIEKMWAIEAQKRLKAYRAGKLPAISF